MQNCKTAKLQNCKTAKHQIIIFGRAILLIMLAMNIFACGNGQVQNSSFDKTTVFVTPTQTLSPSSDNSNTPSMIASSITNGTSNTSIPQSPSNWQYRWTVGLPCRLPCWEGITPGYTTVEEAINILKKADFTTDVTVENVGLQTKYSYLAWRITGSNSHGGQAFYSSKIDKPVISFIYPIFPASTFTFKDIIKTYGEPSNVVATLVPDELGREFFYKVSVIYLAQGLVMTTPQSKQRLTLSDSLTFSDIHFFTANVEGFELLKLYSNELVVNWEGFKNFDYYCRFIVKTKVQDCKSFLKSLTP